MHVFSIFNWSSSYHVTCSTLVIKQKLPGIYVQPSYKSALSKDPLFEDAYFIYTIIKCGYSLIPFWILNIYLPTTDANKGVMFWLLF